MLSGFPGVRATKTIAEKIHSGLCWQMSCPAKPAVPITVTTGNPAAAAWSPDQ
jgi:hypothetical protein